MSWLIGPYKIDSRRVRRVQLDERFLLEFLKPGHRHFTVDNIIPADARLYGISRNVESMCLELLIEHESFAEVEPGCEIPVSEQVTATTLITHECDACVTQARTRMEVSYASSNISLG